MKKWIICLLVAFFSFTSIGFVYAKDAMKLNGKTSQINQEAKTFVLTTENETWKVIWDDKTNFVFDGKKVTSTELKDDIQVVVAGKQTDQEKAIQAVLIAWGKMPGEKDPGRGDQIPNLFGKMSELNLTNKTFKLELKDREGNPLVFTVTYLEKTVFLRDRKPAKPEDFKDGEEVTVAGKVNIEDKTILAMAVALGKMKLPPDDRGQDKPPMIFGKMTGLNLTEKTFNLEIQLKEGDPIVFAVTYVEKTVFIRDKKEAKPEDFKDGEEVTVAGRISREDKKILALAVILGKVETPPKNPGGDQQVPMLFGKMTGLNLTEKTFKLELKDRDGNSIIFTVTYVEKTAFIRDKKQVKPEDFKDGEEVTVAGRISREDKTILAAAVILGKVENPPRKGPDTPPGAPYEAKGVQGRVTEINLGKMQFTIQVRGEVMITIQFHDWTDFVKNGNFVFPTALNKGAIVTVFGPLDVEQKTIDAHYVVW